MSNYSKRKEAELLAKKESNKKTALTIIAVVVVLGILFGGGYYLKTNSNKNVDVVTATGDPDYDVFEYVTLGQYEGVEVQRIIPEVTEEEFNTKKSSLLEGAIEFADISERGVKEGDKVTIDFEGKIDGESFEGGTGTDYEYVLGTGGMVPGFDEGYYGTKVGESKTINITFPEDYHKEEGLNGKDVEFKITVKKAQEVTYKPEWDDEFAKKVSEGKYTTIADYEKSVRDELMKQAEETSKSTLRNDVWSKVFEAAEVEGYPEYLYNKMKIDVNNNIQTTCQQYGITEADYLNYFCGGVSKKEYILQYVNAQLVAEAVKKELNIELSDEKYRELVTADLENYGVSSIEELEEQYTKEVLVDYYTTTLMHDTLVEKAVIKDITKKEYDKLQNEESKDKE